jgi:hypothetical protein
MLVDGLTLANGSVIENPVVAKGTVFPEAEAGELFFDTANGQLMVHDGTKWSNVGFGSSASSIGQALCAMPSVAGSEVGTSRWYPHANIVLIDAFAYCGVSPDLNNVVFSVKKNGVVVAENLTIPSHAFTSNTHVFDPQPSLTPTDYITCDVTVGDETSKNAIVRIRYQTV